MDTRVTFDGKQIAAEIVRDVRERMGNRVPVVRAVTVDPTPATESYLRIKMQKAKEAGMRLEVVRLPKEATEDEIMHAAVDGGADAVIVQLPLPETLDERKVLDAIPLSKDADVLSREAYERFLANEPGALMPPVVCAVAEVLARAEVAVAGKRVVVVGNGRLVGAPVSAWLTREGASLDVLTDADFEERKHLLKDAAIVVSGAGSPHLLTPDLLSPGVALIDAGTSESGGAIVGDFDPACAEVASVFTPVPGGVGPIAVSCLFKNVAELLR